jgi:predicted transcriptional regulator
MTTIDRTRLDPVIPTPRLQVRLEDIAAQEVMATPVVVCRPDDSVARAVELLQRSGTRHVVVCTIHDVVVGVVDERRLARALGHMSWSDLAQPVERIMDRALCRARPDEPLHQVARRLEFSPADAVLITDADGRVLGIVSPTEVVRATAHRGAGERPST